MLRHDIKDLGWIAGDGVAVEWNRAGCLTVEVPDEDIRATAATEIETEADDTAEMFQAWSLERGRVVEGEFLLGEMRDFLNQISRTDRVLSATARRRVHRLVAKIDAHLIAGR